MNRDSGDLGNLRPDPGAVKKGKRIGRGRGSGRGDTATKGHKGAKSRSGYRRPLWFEGGQMPIQRRLPKRGFNIRNRTQYHEINISDLSRIDGDVIDPTTVRSAKLVNGKGPLVLLGNGEIEKAVKVSVHRISQKAREKIAKAGGTVEILPLEPLDLRVKRGPSPKKLKDSKKEAKKTRK